MPAYQRTLPGAEAATQDFTCADGQYITDISIQADTRVISLVGFGCSDGNWVPVGAGTVQTQPAARNVSSAIGFCGHTIGKSSKTTGVAGVSFRYCGTNLYTQVFGTDVEDSTAYTAPAQCTGVRNTVPTGASATVPGTFTPFFSSTWLGESIDPERHSQCRCCMQT